MFPKIILQRELADPGVQGFTSTGGSLCRPSANTSVAPRNSWSFHAVT
jgi:hypothetical protein